MRIVATYSADNVLIPNTRESIWVGKTILNSDQARNTKSPVLRAAYEVGILG